MPVDKIRHSLPRRPAHLPVALLIIALLLIFTCPLTGADELRIGDFSALHPAQGLPPEWTPLVFPNIERHTQYELMKESFGTVVKAVSDNAASGLIRRQRLDARQYPFIQWKWEVDHVLTKGDLKQKSGDDYAARIYVAFAFEPEKATWWQRVRHNSGSFFAGEELPGTALNYIWANKAPVGTIAPNPFAKEAAMIVVQSGPEKCGQWHTEERNLAEDYQKAFNQPPPEIIGIAIMTDTDNTGEQATAVYGDIVLKTDK